MGGRDGGMVQGGDGGNSFFFLRIDILATFFYTWSPWLASTWQKPIDWSGHFNSYTHINNLPPPYMTHADLVDARDETKLAPLEFQALFGASVYWGTPSLRPGAEASAAVLSEYEDEDRAVLSDAEYEDAAVRLNDESARRSGNNPKMKAGDSCFVSRETKKEDCLCKAGDWVLWNSS